MAHKTLSRALLLSLLVTASPAFAADWEGGDAAKGEKVFKKCQSCHTADKEGGHKIGPNLHGVLGSKAAAKAGYSYSPAMKAKGEEGLTWTGPELYAYLENPKAHVPRTTMSFVGLKKSEDRRDVIAYLVAQSK